MRVNEPTAAWVRLNGRHVLLPCCLLCPTAWCAENTQELAENLYRRGHGSVSLSLQATEVSEFNTSEADVDIGSVTTRSAYLEAEYTVSSRWRVKLGVPYIEKDYDGRGRHDPLQLDPPRPEVAYIDDGHFHGNLQDYVAGIQYLFATQPLQIEPFALAIIPSHDYPHFGQAAVGQNLWKVELGVEATHFLPLSDWYYRLALSYTIAEQTLDVSINHFRLGVEVGYFLTPGLAVHGFVSSKHGRGDDGTAFPPSQRTDERWYQHDRTSRHSYINTGIGFDWYFHKDYGLFGSLFTNVWGQTGHLVDWSATVGVTRYF